MSSQVIASGISPGGLFERFLFPPAFRKRIRETRFQQHWQLTPFEYACLRAGWNGEGDPKRWLLQRMRDFNGPQYQRGMLSGFGVRRFAWSDQGGGVAITNHSVTHTDLGNLAQSGVSFTTDGGLDETEALVNVGLIASGEWHEDEPSATGSDYEVRALSTGKTGTWANSAAADDTWIQISADRSWNNARIAKLSPGTTTTTATFELGDNGASSADDSAALTCNSVN